LKILLDFFLVLYIAKVSSTIRLAAFQATGGARVKLRIAETVNPPEAD
jgi:hypothetical protein